MQIYMTLVGVRLSLGDTVGAEKWLREARRSALKFDADPQYRVGHGMKFYHGSRTVLSYDDMGETGIAMIENIIYSEAADQGLRSLWERICKED